ncbi:MAG: hypothetical protein WBD60_11595, partial [Methylovirgula sp.]
CLPDPMVSARRHGAGIRAVKSHNPRMNNEKQDEAQQKFALSGAGNRQDCSAISTAALQQSL